MAKKLTFEEKYKQLKKHTEDAGMTVTEVEGKIVVERIKKGAPSQKDFYESAKSAKK